MLKVDHFVKVKVVLGLFTVSVFDDFGMQIGSCIHLETGEWTFQTDGCLQLGS